MDLISLGLSSGRSSIISMGELIAREGINLQKGMNFRDKDALLSVFLVLPREGGYADEWDEGTKTYTYLGHDSIAEGSAGKSDDQLLMYASGKPTDNGKFYKAANAFKDGLRDAALQIQVYEKLDAGVWFDKGIFNLIDAEYVSDAMPTGRQGNRKVCKFHLMPADAELLESERDVSWDERMLPAAIKAEAWKQGSGRCAVCGSELELHFVSDSKKDGSVLRCTEHL